MTSRYYNKPGTVLKDHYSRKGYRQGGCNCSSVAAKMDRLGCDGCRREIVKLSQEFAASAKKWKKKQGGVWKLIPNPPPWTYFRGMINWAISVAAKK